MAYITDTAKNSTFPTASAVIYAFDVDGVNLVNKRVFATPGSGIPDGIKTDKEGNVYAWCGDGVNVWDSEGVLLGKVVVEGGVANFVVLDGGLVILGESKLWLADMGGLVVRGNVARKI